MWEEWPFLSVTRSLIIRVHKWLHILIFPSNNFLFASRPTVILHIWQRLFFRWRNARLKHLLNSYFTFLCMLCVSAITKTLLIQLYFDKTLFSYAWWSLTWQLIPTIPISNRNTSVSRMTIDLLYWTVFSKMNVNQQYQLNLHTIKIFMSFVFL